MRQGETMSIAYSVENITTIISGIIANAKQLQNISLRGFVSLVNEHSRFFLLKDDKNQINCFIPKSTNVSPLLEESIIVVGDLSLQPTNSMFQIKVTDILEDNIQMPVPSVGDITCELSGVIAGIPELRNIRIQGVVSELFKSPDKSYWNLHSQNPAFPNVSIQCARIGSIDSIVDIDNKICVQGKITLLAQSSKYQIEVSHIEDTDTNRSVECQCPGCEACQDQEEKGTCPPLKNPNYELCQQCYNVSPDRLDRVKNTVFAFFYGIEVDGFTAQDEKGLHLDIDNLECTVALIGEKVRTIAIANCMGAGYVGSGLENLKRHISAADVPYGMFANRVDTSKWQFYKNLGQNRVETITCDKFREEINRLINRITSASTDQIDTLKSKKEDLERILRDLKEQFDEIIEISQKGQQIAGRAKSEIDE